ncbi:MAG: hypothetical protein ACLU0O_07945 [Collinsella sp.]
MMTEWLHAATMLKAAMPPSTSLRLKDFEAIDSLSQGATESDVKTEQEVDSVESDFQYVYLAYPSLPSGSNQVIAFATHNDGEVLSSATLGYVSANGVKGSVDASATADNSAAFTLGKTRS